MVPKASWIATPRPTPLRKGLPQSPFQGERVEDGEEIGPAFQQRAAVLERIALRRIGDLVDEALDREGVLR